MEEVVKRGGWGFVIPADHRLEVDEGQQLVTLTSSDGKSGTYPLLRVERDDEEIVFVLDAESRNGDGYPFPSVGEEIERLRERWESAKGDLTRFNAWAEGASYDSHLRHLRREIRELEALQATAG